MRQQRDQPGDTEASIEYWQMELQTAKRMGCGQELNEIKLLTQCLIHIKCSIKSLVVLLLLLSLLFSKRNIGASPVAQGLRICLQCRSRRRCDSIPRLGRSPGGGHVTYSCLENPWTEEPGYSPQGHKESDLTEVTEHTHPQSNSVWPCLW